MKANEIRVGNLVKYGELSVKVKSYHTESVLGNETIYVELNKKLKNYCLNIDEVEPIPLTEEWLIKFGFEKIGGEWRLNPSFEVQILVFNHEKYNGVMFYTRTIHADYSPIYCTNHINYVHQLQNLYFALTNEELTITQ